MPYIKNEDKAILMEAMAAEKFGPRTSGELNWLLTMFCKRYIDDHGLKYQTINDIVGALEGAKLEFYRRVAAPYEDTKIKENGDVY